MNLYWSKLICFSMMIFVLVPLVANANGTTVTIPNPLKHTTFTGLINAIADFLFNIALALAPIMIIIGGFYFVTAAEDPTRVITGKKIILYTLIGLLIIFLSKGLVALFQEIF